MDKIHFLIELKSPLSHGDFADGQDTGNFMGFRRLPCVGVDKEIHRIPVVSGNSLRGVMRRLLTWEYMEKTGLKGDKLYIALANGGAIGKNLDPYIRPEVIKNIKETFPVLSAFGCALFKFMLPGVVNISFALPQCKELGTGDKPYSDLLADISQTRHIERFNANYQLEEIDIKPMPYTIEVLIPGTVLDCAVSFTDAASGLDKATVFHGLNLLSVIGGKSGEGYGQIALPEDFEDQEYKDWFDSLPEDYNTHAEKLIKSV